VGEKYALGTSLVRKQMLHFHLFSDKPQTVGMKELPARNEAEKLGVSD
jgi:hypothetical protein